MIEIETNRLKIYPATQELMDAAIRSQTDMHLTEAYREMLDGALSHPDQWEWYAMWQIELKDGTPIGDLCFKGICADGTTEIGYGIEDAHQGRGYATEAVAAAAAWAENQPGIAHIVAETEPGNAASQRVLKKCGFRPTGTFGAEGPRFMRK